MQCQIHFDAFAFYCGKFQCVVGSRCASQNSSTATIINSTNILKNDGKADYVFVVYLIIGCLIFLAVFSLIVLLAWHYKFRTEAAPFEVDGIHLAWEGVAVSDLVVNSQGHVSPGAFMAILGPIGAGKSTLLKVLSGRIAPTAGSVIVNQHKDAPPHPTQPHPTAELCESSWASQVRQCHGIGIS